MASISLRLRDDEYSLIQTYVTANGLNMSSFIRESVLERIEDDLKLDEERILAAKKAAHEGKRYSFEEAWDEIGV